MQSAPQIFPCFSHPQQWPLRKIHCAKLGSFTSKACSDLLDLHGFGVIISYGMTLTTSSKPILTTNEVLNLKILLGATILLIKKSPDFRGSKIKNIAFTTSHFCCCCLCSLKITKKDKVIVSVSKLFCYSMCLVPDELTGGGGTQE